MHEVFSDLCPIFLFTHCRYDTELRISIDISRQNNYLN